MILVEQIKADLLQSRKDQIHIKSTLLTTLLGEIELRLKSGKLIEEKDIVATIAKFIKNNAEFQAALKERGDSTNALPKLIVEASILEEYMPKVNLLSDEQVKFAAEQLINTGFKTIGPLIGQMRKTYGESFSPQKHKSIIDDLIAALPK